MLETAVETDLNKRNALSPIAICLLVVVVLGAISWAALLTSLQLGRTTPATVSLAWALEFFAGAIAALLLAGLSWWALSSRCKLAAGTAATRVGVSYLPLFLTAPFLVGLYQSDGLFHYFFINSIPRVMVTWTPPAIMILLLDADLLFSVPLPTRAEAWLRREWSTPVFLFAAFLVLYVFTAGGHLYSPDEREMYQITETMADGALPLVHDPYLPPVDGSRRYYSKYGLVTSALGLPPYLVSRTLGMEPDPPSAAFPIPNGAYPLVNLLVNPVLTAFTVALLYFVARALDFGKSTGVLVSVIFGLTTSSWVYSKTFFSQPPAALFLLGAILFAIRSGKKPIRDFAISGVFLGLAAGSRVEVLLIAAPLCACLVKAFQVDRRTGIRVALAFSLGFVLSASLTTGWYDYVKTGSPFATAHGPQGSLSGFSPKPYIGLFGSLFSSGFGFVTYNPIVALGAVAFPLLAVKRGFEARLFGAMIAIAILLYGSFGDWSGGFTWANRYLVVILPLAVLPVGVLFERPWRGWLGILFTVGASALGFAINSLAVLFDFNNGWLDLWDHRASLLQIQWDAHFSPIGAHVRLLSNFLATGAKLDLYLLYKLGLPALIIFGALLTFFATMAVRSAMAEADHSGARTA